MFQKTIVARLGLLLLAILLLLPPVHADEAFIATHDAAVAKNPAGVTYTLHIDGDKSHFYLGEAIPLVATFISDSSNPHRILNIAQPRTQFSQVNFLHVDATQGVVDPLACWPRLGDLSPIVNPLLMSSYYTYASPSGSVMNTGYNNATQPAGAMGMKFRLNEYLRFDKPGTYSLYLKGQLDPGPGRWREPATFATSNIISLEIEAPPEGWAQAQASLALRRLEAFDALNYHGELCREHIDTLRYLGTPEALEIMLNRLDVKSSQNRKPYRLPRELAYRLPNEERYSSYSDAVAYYFALIAYPRRAEALAAMERRWPQKDYAVTAIFFNALLELQALQCEPPAPTHADNFDYAHELYTAYNADRTAAMTSLWLKLQDTAQTKNLMARATTLNSLFYMAVFNQELRSGATTAPLLPRLGELMRQASDEARQANETASEAKTTAKQ